MAAALRRSGLLLAVLATALLLCAPGAQAHATLEGTTPQRGTTVRTQPEAVVFRFSEPVEGNFGAVRVYDAGAERADEGDSFHPGGEGSQLGVHLKPDLADGTYTATYRVVSADGHIVSGGFVFSIGRPGAAPAETVAELVAGSSAGTATKLGLGVARGVQYAALAVALGALVFLLAVWLPAVRGLGAGSGEPPEDASSGAAGRASDSGGEGTRPEPAAAFAAHLRAALLLAALAGALSAVAAIVCEAAQAAGVSFGSALDWSLLREELGTRFGTVWGLTALAWVLVGAFAAAGGRRLAAPRSGSRPPAPVLAILLPLGFVALEPALSGHPSTQSPVWLLFGANVLHVVAMAVWVGGLASLLLLVPAATRTLAPPERSRLLAALLARFSPLALACVATILLTGLGQAYAYVRHLDALLDTAYGRAVLIKLVLLLAALVPLGAYNRSRSLPRLRRIAAGGEAPARAGLLLRRTLRWEVALLLVVLGVTAALAGYPPATAQQAGPVTVSAPLGPAELEATVDPARVGANQIHLYLFDARSGAQLGGVKQLSVSATEAEDAIGPLPLRPRRAGPGHYVVQGALLGVAGEWQLTVTMRVSAFDQYEAKLEVPIR